MDNKHYRSYFLGQMSADDAEKLELRVISNDDSEIEIFSAEDSLIEDYLDGKLTNEETQAFDTNFLVTGERRKRVEFVQMMRGLAENTATISGNIEEKKPNFFNQLKSLFSPRKFAFGFGGTALILIVGFITYTSLNKYSNDSEISLLLNKSFKNDRPTEARITGFDYAPKIEGIRGNNDKTQDLNLVSAKSRATEAVLKDETAENLHALGQVYLAERNFDEAIKQFEKALKKNPNIARLHNDLGVALMEKGKQKEEGKLELFARANEEIEKSIELNNNLVEAYFNRGLVTELLNLPHQAKEAWENYLKLDSTSKWADEAREHLQKLETNKPVSKTKEEILRDFLQAKQAGDTEKAWQTLSRNREMITGKLIPQQLAFLFVDSKIAGDEIKAKEALDALVYAGKLEEEKSGDLFWRDLAEYYTRVSKDEISQLKQAQDLVSKGYELVLSSDYKTAQDSFRKSSEIFEKSQNDLESAISLHWVALSLAQNGHVKESSNLRKNIEDFAESKNYFWLSATNFYRKGTDLSILNRHTLAESEYEKALIFTEKINDTYAVPRILLELAINESIFGQHRKSLNYLYTLLSLSADNEINQRQNCRNLMSAVEILLSARHNFTARLYAHEAVRLADELNDPIFMTNTRLLAGQVDLMGGNLENSGNWLNAGIEKANSIYDESIKNHRTAFGLLFLADLERKKGNLENSVKIYQQALKIYENLEFSVNYYETQKGLLLSYLALNWENELDTQIPLLIKLAEDNRNEILNEEQRNSFFSLEQDVYEIAVDYEFRKADFRKALEYSEQSRARSLLDLQNSAFEVSVKKNQPEVKFSQSFHQLSDLNQIQAEMPENVQLIEYSVLTDKVLIWVITKNNLNISKVEISSETLQEKVLSYLTSITENLPIDEQHKSANELYQVLIAPIEEKLNIDCEIVFVPDKFLFKLPFSTLYSKKYLIEDYKISYAPSANVFLISTRNAEKVDGEKNEILLSIGNPAFKQSDFKDLPKLPAATQEARKIAEFYNNPIILTENEAVKEAVNKNLSNVDVVHIAGHYVVDEHSPLRSSLVLAGNDKADSSLTNFEILEAKVFHSRLIILSACQTGIEDYYNGEGIIGASRTFLAKGFPQIIASQWSVDSQATKELMINFHRLRKAESLSTVEALRKAQLEMINSEKYQQPYFWAAFFKFGGYARF